MKNKRIMIILIPIFLLTLTIYIYPKLTDNLSAEQVVKKYYEYANKKDIDKLNLLMINSLNFNQSELNDIEHIKLLKIKDESEYPDKNSFIHNVKKGFLQNGLGKELKPFDTKVFYVKYEVQYKNTDPRPLESGMHDVYFTVIQQKKHSPWLIAEIGY